MQALDLDELVPSTLWLIGNWQQWVYRRVESLDFVDERRLGRRVSMDFELPDQAVCIETSSAGLSYAIPLGLFRKGVLRRFDVSDEDDRPLPLLARGQTSEVGARLLVSVAIVALQDAKYDHELDPIVAAELRTLAVSFDRRDGLRILNNFVNAETSLLLAESDLRYKQWDKVARHAASPQEADVAEAIYSRGMADDRVTRRLAEAVGFGLSTIPSISPSEVRIGIARKENMPEAEIQRALLAMDANAGPLMRDLARSYLLYVQVAGATDTRRIVKYAYEHEEGVNLPVLFALLFRIWSALVTLLAGYGVHRITVPLPNLAAAGSFHVEVTSHDELFCSKAWLRVLPPRRRSSAPRWFRTELDEPPSQSTSNSQLSLLPDTEVGIVVDEPPKGNLRDGPGPLIHLYSGRSEPGSSGQLRIDLAMDPSGLLPAGVFIAALIFFLLAGALRLHGIGASRNGDTAAAVIIAAAGLFSVYLFRPGEHRLVRRFMRELRVDTTLLTMLSFLAAGLLAVNWPARQDAWTLLTLGAFVILSRRTLAWIVAESIRRDVHPLQWFGALVANVFRAVHAGVRPVVHGLKDERFFSYAVVLLLIDALLALGSRLFLDHPPAATQTVVLGTSIVVTLLVVAATRLARWSFGEMVGATLLASLAVGIATVAIAAVLGLRSADLIGVVVADAEMVVGVLVTAGLASLA